MPKMVCHIGKRKGVKWGKHGKCYVGKDASKKAGKQARAIYASGYKGK